MKLLYLTLTTAAIIFIIKLLDVKVSDMRDRKIYRERIKWNVNTAMELE